MQNLGPPQVKTWGKSRHGLPLSTNTNPDSGPLHSGTSSLGTLKWPSLFSWGSGFERERQGNGSGRKQLSVHSRLRWSVWAADGLYRTEGAAGL